MKKITTSNGNWHCGECNMVVNTNMNYCPECDKSLEWQQVFQSTTAQEDLTPTPEWIIRAKYKSVLQIVLDNHDWENKYPLLEKIIDGICEQRLTTNNSTSQ